MKPATGARAGGRAAPTRRQVLAGGLAAWAWPAVPAWAQGSGPRVALVIGNAAYPTAPLLNPANDARAMATTLRGMGFDVIESRDASRAQMLAALQQAGARLAGQGGIGLLYYAGHGLQLDWRNFLLPVDAAPASAADVPRLALDVQAVLDTFREAGNRMNIVVLDACRDNPFGRSATARGLAPLDAPPGTFLAYATAPGQVAEDGSAAGGNGLYTGFLVQELRGPQARIEDVFKRVRLQVRRGSRGRQVPWESTSLEEDFVFATAARVPEPPAAERDAAFQVEKADWDLVRVRRDADAYYDYLLRYPSGWFAEPAAFRLDRLQAPRVLPTDDPRTGVQAPRGAARYEVGDTLVWQVFDVATGQPVDGAQGRIEERVTKLDGERVLINGGDVVRDAMGGLHRTPRGRIDPQLLQAPADMAVGKRWRSAFTLLPAEPAAAVNGFVDARVVAVEDIEVPAGRYRAWRVELRGELLRAEGRVAIDETLWLDPATLHRVRHDTRWRDGHGFFEPGSRRLVSFSRRARIPPRPAQSDSY